MTLAQALKKKNKLVKQINEKKKRVRENNSILTTNTRSYVIADLRKDLAGLTDELIALKVQIQTANVPILAKIYQLSEMKDQIAFLRSVSTTVGKITNHYHNTAETVFQAELTAVEVDTEVEALEAKIELLQEEIDTFNHKKKIN